jgi:uncharacterized OsmC-like protein
MSTVPETELNGLSLTKLKELVEIVTKEPERAEELNKWNARVKWQGGFKSEAFVRDHAFFVDEPSNLAGVNTAPNAVEYVLAALGSCYIVGFVLNATKRGVKVNDLEVALEGQLDNVLTFFGLSDKGHPGYREIKAKLYARTNADRKVVEEIWKDTVATSPVSNTLSRNVAVIPEISITR